jgi:RNA polymerase sigma-70 factor (ECF subfamily)
MIELEKSFNKLYEENADAIFRLCLFKTSNREVALDLSQDIFTKMWSYLASGKTVDNQRAFLFTVARNRIKDHYKKRKTITFSKAGLDNVAEYLSADTQTSDHSEIIELLETLQTLPDHHAELLQLRYVEGLTIEELAEIYNIRANTLSVKIHRILHSLRKNL